MYLWCEIRLAATEWCEYIFMMFMYVCIGWLMAGSRSEFLFTQENHTTVGWSNTPDAQFTELSFEAPRASVIYL